MIPNDPKSGPEWSQHSPKVILQLCLNDSLSTFTHLLSFLVTLLPRRVRRNCKISLTRYYNFSKFQTELLSKFHDGMCFHNILQIVGCQWRHVFTKCRHLEMSGGRTFELPQYWCSDVRVLAFFEYKISIRWRTCKWEGCATKIGEIRRQSNNQKTW